MRGDIFSLFFQFFQFDQITVETLYNGHLRDIGESGHCREVERRVNVCHVWTVRQKKKMALVERWSLTKVAVSSKVRLNITWYYLNFFWNLVSLKLQQTVLSNTVILSEINEAILLSIEGYSDVCTEFRTIYYILGYCIGTNYSDNGNVDLLWTYKWSLKTGHYFNDPQFS